MCLTILLRDAPVVALVLTEAVGQRHTFVVVGRLGRRHGLHARVRVLPVCLPVDTRLDRTLSQTVKTTGGT